MRRSPRTSRSLVAACILAAGTLASITTTASAQVGTAITYQGLLERNGVKVTTASDLRFTLFDAATGGAAVGSVVTLNAQQVSNGLFNVSLDFGVNPYTADAARWVQIEVRNPAGVGSFVPMGARQKLTPSPFSLATRGINVDAAGKVGIGTNAPLGLLSVGPGSHPDANLAIQTSTTGVNTSRWISVNKNGGYGLLMGYDEDAAGNYAAIRQVPGDPLNFMVNNTTVAMSLLSNGSVGVGGGPATSDTKFTIHQGYTPLGTQRTNLFLSQPQCGWGTGAEFTNYRYIKTDACSNAEGFFKQFNVAPGGVSVGYPNTPAYNSTDAMYINGNVGIGTNTPFNKLDVAPGSTIGNSTLIGATNDPANRGTKVGFGYHTPADGCGPDVFRGMRVDVVPGRNFCGNSTDISFWTDECNTSCPRPVMFIEGSGNVGIGTTANGYRLNVNGNILCMTVTQTSSRDFKENIVPLTSALDSIMKLNGVTYNWNGKAPEQVQGHRDIGFIADEVNEVLPDIVAKDASGKPIGIDYGKVTPVAVEAIKQLKNENDQLKARLEKIEALLSQNAGNK